MTPRLVLLLLLVLALPGLAAAHVPGTLTFTFYDVGQSDAILVQAPNGEAMLVDAGDVGTAATVLGGLEDEGVSHLAHVVATHDHEDHVGGMIEVLSRVTIGDFVHNGVPASDVAGVELEAYLAAHPVPTRVVTAGDTLALDPANLTVTVLNPPPDPGTDENEASIVLRITRGSQAFLLMGDVGLPTEDLILASGRPVAADLIKIGHHGSGMSTGLPLVQAVDPSVAVITAAREVSFLPSLTVIGRLQETGADVYSTASSGTVRVTATGAGLSVATAEGPALPVALLGEPRPPYDPDFDGAFEDTNGNRRTDFADVVLYFNQMDWIAEYEPIEYFDYNRNDRIDFADVVLLFDEV